MKHRSTFTRHLAGVSLTASIVIAGGSALAAQLDAVDPPSPANGNAQVVATWLVNLEDGAHEWNVATHQVDATGIDLTHTAPTFLIGDGEYSTVITGPEVRGRLADGEALFRRPTLTTHAAALGGEPATLMEWTISTDDTGPGSDPFEPGAGAHDIDIVRDWLAPGETFTMKAGIPAFVMVTSGWVTSADGTRIDEGAWATLQGDIALTNGGDQPAVLLATWISPVIEIPEAPTTSTSTTISPTSNIPPATVPPATAAPTTAAAATTTPPASTTTWPSTTVETTTTWPSTTLAPSTTAAETTTTWVATTVVETSEP
jgi:hypothetical protein